MRHINHDTIITSNLQMSRKLAKSSSTLDAEVEKRGEREENYDGDQHFVDALSRIIGRLTRKKLNVQNFLVWQI